MVSSGEVEHDWIVLFGNMIRTLKEVRVSWLVSFKRYFGILNSFPFVASWSFWFPSTLIETGRPVGRILTKTPTIKVNWRWHTQVEMSAFITIVGQVLTSNSYGYFLDSEIGLTFDSPIWRCQSVLPLCSEDLVSVSWNTEYRSSLAFEVQT